MAVADRIRTINAYATFVANPLVTLTNTALVVNPLPAVADGTQHLLWFADGPNGIVIDDDQATARGWSGAANDDCTIQRRMVLSPMRGATLPVGAVVGARHAPTTRVNAGALASELWVTEMQNGCTVLILDWGGGSYSLFHIQPSQDNQFNWLGRKIIGLGDSAMAAYKNTWLKSEANTIVTNTGGALPQQYIMVQSMFEASRGWVTQLVGVKQGGQFTFYRQRSRMLLGVTTILAERLVWTTWRWWVPWSSY